MCLLIFGDGEEEEVDIVGNREEELGRTEMSEAIEKALYLNNKVTHENGDEQKNTQNGGKNFQITEGFTENRKISQCMEEHHQELDSEASLVNSWTKELELRNISEEKHAKG